MARSQDSYNKREREKKRRKKNQEKRERRERRKAEKEQEGDKSLQDMFSYVDENGNLTNTPPDPNKKEKIKAEDIVLGIPPKVEDPEEKVRSGIVKFFNEEKGYGFIIDQSSGDSLFVHANDLEEPIAQDNRVSFERDTGPKGPIAVKVQLEK